MDVMHERIDLCVASNVSSIHSIAQSLVVDKKCDKNLAAVESSIVDHCQVLQHQI